MDSHNQTETRESYYSDPILRQEVLSGIRDRNAYERLRVKLAAFPNYSLNADDYETAAEYFNTCRGHGIQGANIDFLICAIANRQPMYLLAICLQDCSSPV